MGVGSNVLAPQFYTYQQEYEQKALDVLRSGWYVLGNEVFSFEKEFARYIGTNYSVGLASGLDALWLAFKILNIKEGDEVIVHGNTYIASVMGITINQAIPIFVEPNPFHNIDVDQIESKITDKTKAILVVHLYGQASQMDKIQALCKKHHLYLVEDCAQSHGAKYDGQMTGSFGDIGCFSFYPSQNLGAFGDAGAITTNNQQIAEDFKMYRNYGSKKRYYNEVVGANSRLDELQAGFLRIKLSHLKELNDERKSLCQQYLKELKNQFIRLPKLCPKATTVWHQFVIQTDYRDQLLHYLNEAEIGTIIHYPIPPHLSKAYSYLGLKEGTLPITEKMAKEVLSIPLYNGMTQKEQAYVIEKINCFKPEE